MGIVKFDASAPLLVPQQKFPVAIRLTLSPDPPAEELLTLAPWHTVLWADDPDWTTNPGDGNPVTEWQDRSGNGHDAVLGNAPTFVASEPAFNDNAAIEFHAAVDHLVIPSFVGGPLTQPYTVVVIGRSRQSTGTRLFFDRATGPVGEIVAAGAAASGPGQWIGFITSTGQMGIPTVDSAADEDAHLFVLTNDDDPSGRDRVDLDETFVTADEAADFVASLDDVEIGGSHSTGYVDVSIAFFAILDRELTPAERTELVDLSRLVYGTP